MTDDLARRLVAHPRWEWWAGMRATWPDDSRPSRRCEHGWASDYSAKERWHTDDGATPDITDDATAGVLLGLLHADVLHDGGELCAAWEMGTDAHDARWCVEVCWCWAPDGPPMQDMATYGPTLGEAVAHGAAGGVEGGDRCVS